LNLDPQYYGASVASYKGTGILDLNEGKKFECAFVAMQLINGKIVVLGSIADFSAGFCLGDLRINQLSGQTTGGDKLDAQRFFVSGLNPRWSVESGSATDFRFFVSDLVVQHQAGAPRFWRFKILNAHLPFNPNSIIFPHPFGHARIQRAPDYDDVVDRLRTGIQDFGITAQIEIETNSRSAAEEIAEDVCYLLSIACGTKVQWITYEECDDERKSLAWIHSNKVTKRYVPLPTIDYRELKDTEQFLLSTLATFIQRKPTWELSKGLIDSYLDAKQDADYLETRALKLVAAVERFKRIFIANLRGASRQPFGRVLDAIHEFLDIEISAEDRNLFVRCRNSLVHDGRFYCELASDEDRGSVSPQSEKSQEHYWLLHVVDRLFLRLVGYEGPYVDWSATNPVRRPQIPLRSTRTQA
jgi:hypothetical protein